MPTAPAPAMPGPNTLPKSGFSYSAGGFTSGFNVRLNGISLKEQFTPYFGISWHNATNTFEFFIKATVPINSRTYNIGDWKLDLGFTYRNRSN